ncbi:MAG: hypothetical protein HPY50_14555 [Firmicutes bacterium]|nr:hypothetical protein [Bacillota bacterium]
MRSCKGAIDLAETQKTTKKRSVKSDPGDNRIAIGEHRAYCVHCGAKNLVKPNWRTVTCSSCGKKGPVEEKPPPKKAKRVSQPRKAKAEPAAEPEKAETATDTGNRMILNTVIAIGAIVALSMVLRLVGR